MVIPMIIKHRMMWPTALALTLINFWADASPGQEISVIPPIPEAEIHATLGIPSTSFPYWSRQLAPHLPNATLAVLNLETRHRFGNPIGNPLAAQIRLIVAETLQCETVSRQAREDLQWFGLAGEELEQVSAISGNLPPTTEKVLLFARDLTKAGYRLTDEEVQSLRTLIGDEALVGIVHTIAFANFQCRVIQGLGDQFSPLQTVEPLVFSRETPATTEQSGHRQPAAPTRPALPSAVGPAHVTKIQTPLEWQRSNRQSISDSLAFQTKRTSRIPIPNDAALQHFTEEEWQRSSRVIWSRVSLGYQPELTRDWFKTMRLFRSDSDLDQVFANSLFLVVTRSNECFY